MGTSFLTTFSDLQTELQTRLNATSQSTLFTTTLIQQQLNNAYAWAGRLFKWPQLKDAQVADTKAGISNYDFPPYFQPESIFRIEISDYTPPLFVRKDFGDYLDYIENYPSSTEQIFANYWTQFFVWPIPQTNGSGNISVWGYKQVTAMAQSTDTTIFSNFDPLGNEAIVKQALSVCEAIGEGKGIGQIENQEAKEMLATIFSKVKEDSQNDQRLDHPLFRVPDYMSGSITTTDIGSFNVTTTTGSGGFN